MLRSGAAVISPKPTSAPRKRQGPQSTSPQEATAWTPQTKLPQWLLGLHPSAGSPADPPLPPAPAPPPVPTPPEPPPPPHPQSARITNPITRPAEIDTPTTYQSPDQQAIRAQAVSQWPSFSSWPDRERGRMPRV